MMGKGRLLRCILLLLVIMAGLLEAVVFMKARWVREAAASTPSETIEALNGADRGFYHIHGFLVKDSLDAAKAVSDSYAWEKDSALSLIQFNLRQYSSGDISDAGLATLEALFEELRKLDKRYIVRFVYDWDGKNMEVEPQDISIVLGHMEQVAGVVNRNKDLIYTLQGLFVGNWGEMNGTRYGGKENWSKLAEKLAQVTDEDIYLAVRMPFQWRCATGYAKPLEELGGQSGLAARMGLYNDGIMGSFSDLGTYGANPRAETDYEAVWDRTDELAFQNELCRVVPNGGEVVADNPYNDFPQAVSTLRTMHVSYLNRDYDSKVLEKWASARVTGEGIWNAMDGLTYVERHLGYRFVIRGASLSHRFWRNTLELEVALSNVGFAPIYRPVQCELVMVDGGGEVKTIPLEGDPRELAGGLDRLNTLLFCYTVSAGELSPGDYTLYFRMRDARSGEEIQLANEGYVENYGYRIGGIKAK